MARAVAVRSVFCLLLPVQRAFGDTVPCDPAWDIYHLPLFFLLCSCVCLPEGICVFHMRAWCQQRPEEGVRSGETGVRQLWATIQVLRHEPGSFAAPGGALSTEPPLQLQPISLPTFGDGSACLIISYSIQVTIRLWRSKEMCLAVGCFCLGKIKVFVFDSLIFLNYF